MRFLMLIHVDETNDAGAPPDSLIAAMDELRADTAQGYIVDDGGLMPSATAVRVRSDAGRVTMLDGPFAEAKEVIGGFFVVESPSPDGMATWTRSFVELHAAHWPGLSYVAEVRQIATDPST